MADPVTFGRLCAVLAAVVDYYDRNKLALPARRYVAAGLPAQDCEQVTVRAARQFPHESDVRLEQPVDWLGVQEGVAVEVEVVRSAPVSSETGEPPGVTALNTASKVLYDDGDHVLAALREAVGSGALPGCKGVVWLGWRTGGESGALMWGVSELLLNLS